MWGQHILALLFLLLAVFAISQIFRLIRQRCTYLCCHLMFSHISVSSCHCVILCLRSYRHSLVGFHFAFLALSLITCVFHAVDMICFTSTLSPMAFFFTSLSVTLPFTIFHSCFAHHFVHSFFLNHIRFPLCPQLSTYSLLIIFIMSVTDKTRWRVWGRAVVLGWLGFIITVLAFICCECYTMCGHLHNCLLNQFLPIQFCLFPCVNLSHSARATIQCGT